MTPKSVDSANLIPSGSTFWLDVCGLRAVAISLLTERCMMYRIRSMVGLAVALLLPVGCTDEPLPQDPSPDANFAAQGGLVIRLEDQCDAASFNAVLGEDTCVNPTAGGITFDRFIALLTQTRSVGAWRITPAMLVVEGGATVPVVNTGFEEHTYTEVDEFGGGIVPVLNDLIGESEVAPECIGLAAGDFLAPGESHDHEFEETEAGQEEKYMCCIHPWMRQTVRVR
jgi:plastocyanin